MECGLAFDRDLQQSDAIGSHSKWDKKSDDSGAEDSTSDGAGTESINGGR